MKLLFDQGTPAPLRRYLTGHTVTTTYEAGWSDVQNGDLLREAEKVFDAFIITDQNLRYQQNLSGRRLAVLVLPTTNWPRIRRHVQFVVDAVNSLQPGDFRELELPE